MDDDEFPGGFGGKNWDLFTAKTNLRKFPAVNRQLNFSVKKKPQTSDYVLQHSKHILWLKVCERSARTVLKTEVNLEYKPGSNEDESRWELAGESLHECFLNSHCSVKRAVRVAWELTRVFLLFSISLFLLIASPLLFLRFLTLVKLLTVRVITPTVTRRWYVIIFSFFLLLLLMGNNLEIACFCNSLRLSCNSHDRSNEPKPLIDSHENLNQLKVDESARELMRVDESWRSNESENCDSHPLSSSFDQALIRRSTPTHRKESL